MAAVTAAPTTHYDFFSTTLKQSMTSSSQTSGIKLNSLKDNDGNARTLTTTSVILRFSRGGKQELISAGGWTQDANGVFTLTDVRRDLNIDDPTSFASGSDGIKWPAGTRVECVIDGRTIGKLARLDGANTFTTTQTFTGQVDMDGGFKQPVYANTTARDAFYTSPEEGDECVVTGTGKQTYIGGAWVTTNAAATGFASTTVQGTVEIGAAADNAASTDTGGSGAKVVLPTSLVVKTPAGAGDENKVPCLDSSGKLAAGFIPSVSTNYNIVRDSESTSSSTAGTSTASVVDLSTGQFTIPSGELITGVTYRYEASGTLEAANDFKMFVYIGSVAIMEHYITTPGTSKKWLLRGRIVGTQAAGASVTVKYSSELLVYTNSGEAIAKYDAVEGSTGSVVTNSDQTWKFSIQFTGSSGTNAAVLTSSLVEKLSTTAA